MIAVLEKPRVAVIGAGPTGLSMLKTLSEDGFEVTLYERRGRVGGLWAYSDNPAWTSAHKHTRANISKFPCGFSDFPMPDKYPTHLDADQFQEYMEEYARHFDILKNIVFNTTVKQAKRNSDDTHWLIDVEREGFAETVEYDRVVFCHGYQAIARYPVLEGREKFQGIVMHSQAYRDPEPFRAKNIVVIGLGSSAGDIIPNLMPVATKVYTSHRRGAIPIRRFTNGTPTDLSLTWRRRQITGFLQRYFPEALINFFARAGIDWMVRRSIGKLDPAWRLQPFPNPLLNLPGIFELVLPFLRNGSLTTLHGLKRFLGPRSIEFADGTILKDIDAVICCTGYIADWSVARTFIETSRPSLPAYKGPDMYRLFMNMFPPAHARTCAILSYSAFGKSNGFSFADVTSMAVSNVFRGVEPLPSREDMDRHIDAHQRWIARRWLREPLTDTSAVKNWEFQDFLHRTAGTGMESLGWGWKGWVFWWRDRRMYNMMNNGVECAHLYRYFETGKRPTWPGARDAINHLNEVIKAKFPIEEEEEMLVEEAGGKRKTR